MNNRPTQAGPPPYGWQFADVEREIGTEAPADLEIMHRDSAVPFWAIMAFTFVLFISPQSLFPVLGPLHLALMAALLAIVAYLSDRFIRRRPILEFTRETIVVLCLIGWTLVTLPLSYWPGGSVGILVDIYFKTLIVFWLLSQVVNTLPRLRLIAWGLSLMAIPIALTALVNFVSGDYIEAGLAPNELRIVGYGAPLTGNPNDLALTLNLFLPLSVALFLGSRSQRARLVLLICVALEVIGIIATFSRGGFLTLTVTFVMYLWTLSRQRQQRWVFLALFFAIAAVPMLPTGYLERLSTITNITTDTSGSAQARWDDTLSAIKYVAYHPVIGAGVGMDTLALNEVRGPKWTEVHNAYLQYAVDLGVPGLILFLMLLRGAIKSARYAQRRAAQEPRARELFHLAGGIRISLIAFSVAALFHPVAYHFYFYYFAALALVAKAISLAINDAASTDTETVRYDTDMFLPRSLSRPQVGTAFTHDERNT